MSIGTAAPSLGKHERTAGVDTQMAKAAPSSHLVKYEPSVTDLTNPMKDRGEEERSFFSYDDAAEFARSLVNGCAARPATISIYEKMSVEVTVGVQPYARPCPAERIR